MAPSLPVVVDLLAHDRDDFRRQIVQMKKMGPFAEVIRKIPGLHQFGFGPEFDADGEMDGLLKIIDAMTEEERREPGAEARPGALRGAAADGNAASGTG